MPQLGRRKVALALADQKPLCSPFRDSGEGAEKAKACRNSYETGACALPTASQRSSWGTGLLEASENGVRGEQAAGQG